ncbi:MAG: hypothetical protein M5U08_04720 [Burkholderiales bacterium]|nr:hypothetical protein [Burkholderiales bacterium]
MRRASNRARSGCIATAATRQAAARTTSVRCQPIASASGGATAPASAPPIGTPVCLIEKMSAIIGRGVAAARMCELVGVTNP